MVTSLRISVWNANDLNHHVQEIILFLNINKIDILLVSESHRTEHTFVKISHYAIYYANHPDATAHTGSVIIETLPVRTLYYKQNTRHYSMA
jgi:hypothetical protein